MVVDAVDDGGHQLVHPNVFSVGAGCGRSMLLQSAPESYNAVLRGDGHVVNSVFCLAFATLDEVR